METHEMIRHLRQSLNMSQTELAHLTGYSDRSSIAKVEAGKVDLSQSKIALFASALGVTPGELMQITDTAPVYDSISDDERQLLESYRLLNPEGKQIAQASIHALTFTHAEKNNAAPNMETA